MTAAPARTWDDRWLDRVETVTRARSDARFAALALNHTPGRQAAVTPARAIPARWLNRDASWQGRIRRYDREGPGFVGYSLDLKALVAAMVPLHMEVMDAQGKWGRCTDATAHQALSSFKGLGNDQDNLIFRQFRTLESVGEYWMAPVDTPHGLRWLIAQTPQMQFHGNGTVTIRLRPDQAIMDQTTIKVEVSQVVRCHHEDPEWPGEAYSAYRRAIDDIERYRATVRNIGRTLNSRLLTNGLLWFAPDDASRPQVEQPDTPIQDVQQVMKDYTDVAWKALNDDSDFASYAPFPVSGQSKPEYVEVGRSLDEHVMAAEQSALQAVGRSINFPQQLLVEGPGAGNHWSDLLLKDDFLTTGIAPGLGEVCGNVTAVAIRPVLEVMKRRGAPLEDPQKYRVWYDLTDVAKRPDTSEQMIAAWRDGLVGYRTAGAALGLGEEEMLALPADVSEYEHWREVHSRTAGLAPGAAAPPAAPDPNQSPSMTAAAGPADTHTGVMLALIPDPRGAGAVVQPDGLPASDLHLTLAFLGDIANLTAEQRSGLLEQAQALAQQFTPVTLRVGGVAALGNDDPQAVALLVEAPQLEALRDGAIQAAQAAGIPNGSSHPGFIAHVTVGYGIEMPQGLTGTELPASTLRVALGASITDIPLGARTAAPTRGRPPRTAAPVNIGAKLSGIDKRLFDRVAQAAEVAFAATMADAGRALMRLLPKGDLRTKLRDVPLDEVWYSVPADARQELGFTETDVLGPEPFGQLSAQARDAFLAAADQMDQALEDDGLPIPPEPDHDAAVAFLLASLTGLAVSRLNDPHPPPPRGEHDPFRRVPPGIVRDSLRVAAGAAHVGDRLVRDPAGRPQMPDGTWVGGDGPASGPRTIGAIEDDLGTGLPYSYEWVHGGTSRPFEPHEALDGVSYTDAERDTVLANPTDWPEPVLYPGDHGGCECYEIVNLELPTGTIPVMASVRRPRRPRR